MEWKDVTECFSESQYIFFQRPEPRGFYECRISENR